MDVFEPERDDYIDTDGDEKRRKTAAETSVPGERVRVSDASGTHNYEETHPSASQKRR